MYNGIVVKGDYKGRAVTKNVMGKVYLSTKILSLSKKDKIELNSDTVAKMELMSEGSSGTGSSFMQEFVFGTAAAINTAKNKVLVAIELKNGKRFLLECGKGLYQALQINCFA